MPEHVQGHLNGVFRPGTLPTGTGGEVGAGNSGTILDTQLYAGGSLILDEQLRS